MRENQAMDSRILVCGNDLRLLETREIVLRTTFHRVTSALGMRALRRELEGAPADLVVLCHTLLDEEQREITNLLHNCWSGSRILVLAGVLGDVQRCGGERLSVYEGPRALIDRAMKMTGGYDSGATLQPEPN